MPQDVAQNTNSTGPITDNVITTKLRQNCLNTVTAVYILD